VDRLYDDVFVSYILKMFNEDSVCGPTDILHVSILVHTFLRKSKATVATVTVNPPASFGNVLASGGTDTAFLMSPPRRENQGE
jgi:hypothetical protein